MQHILRAPPRLLTRITRQHLRSPVAATTAPARFGSQRRLAHSQPQPTTPPGSSSPTSSTPPPPHQDPIRSAPISPSSNTSAAFSPSETTPSKTLASEIPLPPSPDSPSSSTSPESPSPSQNASPSSYSAQISRFGSARLPFLRVFVGSLAVFQVLSLGWENMRVREVVETREEEIVMLEGRVRELGG
ncbi:MAG: hypothetical protein M1828_006572 [Chrysothrix sp. TS-e1954]|nr:MAG: hypothetical protein M1828_006572 [Chrysothrix sp. TS-e1954]